MTAETNAPEVASHNTWRAARVALLEKEKQLTRAMDAVNAERRRLPMVRLDKTYRFIGPAPDEREASLLDLFADQRQLIVYHFMFDPDWDDGCSGCTGFVDSLGDLSMLGKRDTSFALISRAPLAKLNAYRERKGWPLPWYSSFGSDFNYDFHATLDEKVAPPEYNYRDLTYRGEAHALSVFFRINDDIFHTYSTFARGVEGLTDAYHLLDATPWGRQEAFEDSPPGWPQRPTYG